MKTNAAIVKVHNPATHAVGPLHNAADFGAALTARDELASVQDEGGPRFPLNDGATLSEFYDRWFKPVVLVAEQRCAGTLDNYADTLQLWCLLTCDPSLRDIDAALISGFVKALKTVGYKRSPDGDSYQFSAVTIREHLRRLAAMLGRAGNMPPRNGACARLLQHVPGVPRIPVTVNRKPAFTLDEARQVAAACKLMCRPTMPDRPLGITPVRWWKALIALLFYTGLRMGTVCKLRWRDFEEDKGQLYLSVPAHTTKTGKFLRLAVHRQLADVLRLKAGVSKDHLVLPHVCDRRTMQNHHRRLQREAGLKPVQMLPFHAWRRTHGQLLGELGLANAEQLASTALDHGSVAVTKAHYISVVDHFRLRLPDLWPHGTSDEQQLPLF